jgi:hypothetical protein
VANAGASSVFVQMILDLVISRPSCLQICQARLNLTGVAYLAPVVSHAAAQIAPP